MSTYCPDCGTTGPTVPVLFGMPDADLLEAASRGEVAVGGCVLELGAPTNQCVRGGHRFIPDDPDGPPRDFDAISARHAEALAGAPWSLTGRAYVRSYDTTRSRFFNVDGVCLSRDRMREEPVGPRVREGDTVFYLGEVRGEDATCVWSPTRILWAGSPGRNGQRWVLTWFGPQDRDVFYVRREDLPLPLRQALLDHSGGPPLPDTSAVSLAALIEVEGA